MGAHVWIQVRIYMYLHWHCILVKWWSYNCLVLCLQIFCRGQSSLPLSADMHTFLLPSVTEPCTITRWMLIQVRCIKLAVALNLYCHRWTTNLKKDTLRGCNTNSLHIWNTKCLYRGRPFKCESLNIENCKFFAISHYPHYVRTKQRCAIIKHMFLLSSRKCN